MWSLTHISAQNICSFRDLDYTPRQGVTTLVFGQNIDNENQKSNGSGKSTLIEAIAVGITGSPLRKVRTEEIINDGADSCYVQLRFENNVTEEKLVIEREIFRKETSKVFCTLHRDGVVEDVAESSVDAYNRYILDKIGITRDELFSSFILSKHKYSDFLSSSDKDKKEIINRFSNGVLVDQAIEKITLDIEPVQVELKDVEIELAGVDGRIEMLIEQISEEENARSEKERSRKERVESIQNTIASKEQTILEAQREIDNSKILIQKVNTADKDIQKLEDSDAPLERCISEIHTILSGAVNVPAKMWGNVIQDKRKKIDDAKADIEKWNAIIATTGQKIARAEKDLILVRKECEVFEQDAGEKYKAICEEMEELNTRLSSANERIQSLKKRKRELSARIELLDARLAGTVTCPECEHQFLVSDKTFHVENGKLELQDAKITLETVSDNLLDSELEAEKVGQMQTHLRNEIRALELKKEEYTDLLQKSTRALESAQYEMEGNRFNLKRVQDFVTERVKEFEDIRRSVFDDAYGKLDEAETSHKRIISGLKENIEAAKGSIITLKETIREIENTTADEFIISLRDSLKEYRLKSAEILRRKTGIELELKSLIEQQKIFVQFKSYLANTKIDALGGMMNAVLDDLGSDIRILMSGYTVLKSGSIREKISVSLIRDGVDCGSFGKFSEGEKMRVNLSSIIAMQKLVNGNCDFGKGLDLLVIDELGDSLDETGLASTFSAINKLGLTAIVVSHGLTNEAYPYKLQIVKENGESRIDNR